jgi:Carboxypeptidase regulatory-like domain
MAPLGGLRRPAGRGFSAAHGHTTRARRPSGIRARAAVALTRLAATLLSMIAVAAMVPAPLRAQTFQGRVVDDRDERPVPMALVRLVDADGEQRAVSIADSTGFYRLRAPKPGVYRLEAARLGFEKYETPLLEAASAEGIYPIDLLMRAAPVELPGFTVETNRVSDEEADRRVRLTLGASVRSLRYEPIRFDEIQDHIANGRNLEDLMRWTNTVGMTVRYTTDGPCFSLRSRGCLPVYLNGMLLSRDFMPAVPLDMLYTIVVVTPTDPVITYPGGAVLLYTEAWLR